LRLDPTLQEISTMNKIFLFVAVIACTGACSARASDPSAAAVLAGTAWRAKLMPDDPEAGKKGHYPFTETLVFAEGKVSMTECNKWGFSPSVFTVARSGDAISFAAEQRAGNGGRAAWQAEFKGDTFKGTMVWTRNDGAVLKYIFEGMKVEK
jgi:hypothetical protein